MTGWYWSVLLAGFGLIGLYLAGRNNYWGWALGLLDEALWVVYAVHTQQWAFCLSAMAYGWVYLRNLRAWAHREHIPHMLVTPPEAPLEEPTLKLKQTDDAA
jgi:hypothetical protein